MEPRPVQKTKLSDDCPIVEEITIERLKRVERTIKACQDTVRTSREVVEDVRKTRARTRQLLNKNR